MSRRSRHSGRDLPIKAEINVTSLVDVAFTLLVIFIITAPVLQGGIEVDLPKGEVPPITAVDDRLHVTIDQDGRIFVGETEVAWNDFEESFPQLVRAARPEAIYISGDSVATYGRFAGVWLVIDRVAKEEGISVGLIIEQRER